MDFRTCNQPFVLILISLIQISSSFHWDGNIVYDLESNTNSDFAIEAIDWSLSSYVTLGIKYSQCANDYIIGGWNVLGGVGLIGFSNPYQGQYFERTYDSVPIHNQIYLQMKFYQLGTWDNNIPPQPGWTADYFDIAIDGTSITAWVLSQDYSGTSLICGEGAPDFIFIIALTYPHSASSLNLRMIITSEGHSMDETFGFREIKIEFLTNSSPYFSLCAPDVPSSYLSDSRCQTSCASPGSSLTPANYGFCFPSSSCSPNCRRCSDTPGTCTCCQTGWFLVDTTCYQTCDSPFSTKTLGGVVYCETPCPGEYLWWDLSCLPSCSYTTAYGSYALVETTTNSFLECTYQCASNEFLYWNTSCLSSCPSPLITTTYKGRNFCEYPCDASQFLYWNGSCLSTCPSPLISEIQDTRKFCWYGCQPTEYLYWNGSCLSACPSPLSSEIQGIFEPRNFCWYLCQENEYLYWNGSCLSTCPSPLSLEIQGLTQQRNFCWYSCSEAQYLYWNGSCLSTCPSPLVSEIQSSSQPRKFCWFPCQPSEYLYWNGSCINNCPSPLSPETQGTTDQRNFCWYSCQPGEYLYWNGSCLSTCPSPLSSEIQGTTDQRKFCWYSCQPADYLYWNGSCLLNCPSPLSPETQGTIDPRNFCWYTCPETQYLYWNGSCIDTCPDPLTAEIQQGASSSRNFCWYSCQPSEYLYWNGSCINNCPSPLTSEIQGTIDPRNFCWYTCDVTEYLYWNQSCSSHCPIPLVSFDLSNNLFCFLPCDMPNIYWYQDLHCRKECNFPYFLLYRDSVYQCLKPCPRPSEYFYDLEKKCSDVCELPYVRQLINGIKVCHITSSMLSSEIGKIETTAGLLEALGQVISTVLKVIMIPELSGSRSPLLVQFSTMIQYIRYMRINYPWRLRILFEANGAKLISLNFDFSIPNWVQDELEDYSLPDVFEKYDLESNFINNLWDLMTTALLVIFILLVLLLLRRLVKKYRKISHTIAKIIQSLKWNTLLAMICADCGEIIFYASLHIRNTPLGSPISIIFLIITLLMISFIFMTLGICLKILYDFRLHKQKRASSDWLEKWKGYEMLYEEIEQESVYSLAYMVIYIIRSLLFFAIIANLYEYPLLQSIMLNVINLLIFGYLLYFKPLQNKVNIMQLFINEILGDIQMVCVLALAKMDREETDDPYTRFTLGNIIIVIIVTFYVLGVVFLAIEGISFSIKAYKTWKEMRARGIRNPFKIIKILLFGELSQTRSEEVTLELSQSSSMLNLNTMDNPAHFHNNPFPKSQSTHTIHSGARVNSRRSKIFYDHPSHSSPQRFSPAFNAQNTRFGIEGSQPNRVRTRVPKRKDDLHQNKHEIQATRPDRVMTRAPKKKTGPSQNRVANRNTTGLIVPNIEPTLP